MSHMEQAAVGRRAAIPQVDADRHPFLDGDDGYDPAVRPSVQKKTPQTFHMESAQDEWRPSIAPMAPTSANAAGVTDARRSYKAANVLGSQLHHPDKIPEDDKEFDPDAVRHKTWTPHSHMLTVGRVPYGGKTKDTKASIFPTADDPEEADCFGRPKSLHGKPSGKGRPAGPTQHEATHFSFVAEGTESLEPGSDDGIDADTYRRQKAAHVKYEWEPGHNRPASANPNFLIADRPEKPLGLGNMRGRGGITPAPDSMSIEKGTSVVGSEWGRAVDVTSEPVTLNPKGSPSSGTKYHDPWGHNLESEGVIAYKHSRGAGALKPRTDDYRLVDPRAEERRKHEAAIMEATALRTEELMCDMKGMCQNDAVLAANRERARGSFECAGRVPVRGEAAEGYAAAAARELRRRRARPRPLVIATPSFL